MWKSELIERNLRIERLRSEGKTLRAIGSDVGLSAERVRHIVIQNEQQRKGRWKYYETCDGEPV